MFHGLITKFLVRQMFNQTQFKTSEIKRKQLERENRRVLLAKMKEAVRWANYVRKQLKGISNIQTSITKYQSSNSLHLPQVYLHIIISTTQLRVEVFSKYHSDAERSIRDMIDEIDKLKLAHSKPK